MKLKNVWKIIISSIPLLFLSLLFCVMPSQAAGLLTPKDSNIPVLDVRDHQVKIMIEDGKK